MHHNLKKITIWDTEPVDEARLGGHRGDSDDSIEWMRRISPCRRTTLSKFTLYSDKKMIKLLLVIRKIFNDRKERMWIDRRQKRKERTTRLVIVAAWLDGRNDASKNRLVNVYSLKDSSSRVGLKAIFTLSLLSVSERILLQISREENASIPGILQE